jgi:predicted transcriptional regulator
MRTSTKPFAGHAARVLLAEGVTQCEVAKHLGVSRRCVGLYLDGRRRTPTRLPEVLRSLIGEDGAANVLTRIPPYCRERTA